MPFNGGRSQIGVNFVQVGNEYPFLNYLKSSQYWVYSDNTSVPAPDELDANGYPLAASAALVSHGGVYTVFDVSTQAERPGRYAITWDGTGTIQLSMSHSAATGALTAGGGPGGTNRYEFLPGTSDFNVGIASGTVTNMKVFHVDDEAALLAGGVFGTKFLQRLREGNFGVIRFLDWMFGNTTNVTTWATRKPVGYYSYASYEGRAEFYGGVTTNAGSAYSVSAPSTWSGLVDKAMVIVKWNASSASTAPTLNVGGTGAITIQPADISAGGLIFSSWLVTSGEFAQLVYDATMNCWLMSGGDNDQLLQNGVPPEICLQLCAEVGAHPYFTTPYLAIDPATDYMQGLAEMCRDDGESWMVPRFEGTNETWNSALGFKATRFAWAKAQIYWPAVGAFGHDAWYGKTMSVLGQIISSVYSADRSRYRVLAGVQTFGSAADTRLTAAEYVAQAAAAQSPFTKSAAYEWVTNVCCANYTAPSRFFYTLQEVRDGFAYVVTHAGNASAQAADAASYASSLAGAASVYNLASVNDKYEDWQVWAAGPWGGSYSLTLMGYEGGYSPDYYQTNYTGVITGATRANPCVLTIATTLAQDVFTSISGNPCEIGMTLTISSVAGMTQLNGNTYTVTAVSGNNVTINVDASAFGVYTSGGSATIVDSALWVNTIRYAGKFATDLYNHTLTNYNNFLAAGGTFPSQFLLAGTSFPFGGSTPNGQVWASLDPSVYATNSPAWDAIVAFNTGRRNARLKLRFR
jgi:hypothetical protein